MKPVPLAALAFLAAMLLGCAGSPASPPPLPSGLRELEVLPLANPVTGYATFQSHNQKVVANRKGYFVAFILTRNEAYTAQKWRLVRSTDQGQTFQTLYEDTNATNPPILETDDQDNIYLFRSDDVANDAYLYRFLASENYARPHVTFIRGEAAGKFCAAIDLPRKQIYHFAHNEYFSVLSLDGSLLRTTRLFQPGKDAALQYPLLALDGRGNLHAAWTTLRHGVYLYWDIHHMVSRDGAQTWQTLDGKPLTPPIVADQNGPTPRVTRDDEFDSHTWLANLLAHDGKLHMAYLAQTKPPRMHYLRYDIASAQRDRDVWPVFKGDTLEVRNLDGFFTASRDPHGPIYFTMTANRHLACLVSYDNGNSWHDLAISKEEFPTAYSTTGCRTVTPDGYIIGAFTQQIGTPADLEPRSIAHFIRIKVQ